MRRSGARIRPWFGARVRPISDQRNAGAGMFPRSFASAALLAGCVALGAEAAAEPFYQGKRPTIFVNFAAGGPTDIEARLFTRAIARHIEGNPQLIVRNMDGAGGMAGANYLGEVAPHDGTYIGYFSSVAW